MAVTAAFLKYTYNAIGITFTGSIVLANNFTSTIHSFPSLCKSPPAGKLAWETNIAYTLNELIPDYYSVNDKKYLYKDTFQPELYCQQTLENWLEHFSNTPAGVVQFQNTPEFLISVHIKNINKSRENNLQSYNQY